MEESSKLALPDAFLDFLKVNGLDPSIYTASDSTPRYIRYSQHFFLFINPKQYWLFIYYMTSEFCFYAK